MVVPVAPVGVVLVPHPHITIVLLALVAKVAAVVTVQLEPVAREATEQPQ